MDITHYFDLLKQGRNELIEYEEILAEIDRLKLKAKKNTLQLKKKLTKVTMGL